jgi:hypothetical protein
MEVLLCVIGSIVTAVILGRFLRKFSQRCFVPDQYEWLKVMSGSKWKLLEQLCDEMRSLKKTACKFHVIVENDLLRLTEEGLVECKHHLVTNGQYGTLIEKFRMTPAGYRRLVLPPVESADLDFEDAVPA